jgi:hypothetical protein
MALARMASLAMREEAERGMVNMARVWACRLAVGGGGVCWVVCAWAWRGLDGVGWDGRGNGVSKADVMGANVDHARTNRKDRGGILLVW